MMINRAQIKKKKSNNPTENPRYSEPNESETLFRFLDAEEKKKEMANIWSEFRSRRNSLNWLETEVSRWNSVRNSLISSAESLVKLKLAEIPRTASGFLNQKGSESSRFLLFRGGKKTAIPSLEEGRKTRDPDELWRRTDSRGTKRIWKWLSRADTSRNRRETEGGQGND